MWTEISMKPCGDLMIYGAEYSVGGILRRPNRRYHLPSHHYHPNRQDPRLPHRLPDRENQIRPNGRVLPLLRESAPAARAASLFRIEDSEAHPRAQGF